MLNELALFAGAGGGLLGGLACGFHPVCAVELDEYARRVLLARQRDGFLPRFPVWDDVRTFDGRPWRGRVDVITGGFPCQDISSAGKRAGLGGEKSGLWSEFARIIGGVQPTYAFIENSPHLRTRGLDVVLRDLASLGYDAEWMVLGAADVGAPHQRDRIWILAHTNRSAVQLPAGRVCGESGQGAPKPGDDHEGWRRVPTHADDDGERVEPVDAQMGSASQAPRFLDWPMPPGTPRVDDGVAFRMDRTRSTGNGQVARVAALAWSELLVRTHRR